MEQFSRECLEIETKAGDQEHHEDFIVGASMERVYDRAAKLVKRTLDVEGVIVMDISHCEVIETMGAEGTVSVVIHHGDPRTDMKSRTLSQEEYSKLVTFFSAYPDGKISEGIVPTCLRPFLPTHIQYALSQSFHLICVCMIAYQTVAAVPIFNIDKRPFALLCAYNSADHPTRFVSLSIANLRRKITYTSFSWKATNCPTFAPLVSHFQLGPIKNSKLSRCHHTFGRAQETHDPRR